MQRRFVQVDVFGDTPTDELPTDGSGEIWIGGNVATCISGAADI